MNTAKIEIESAYMTDQGKHRQHNEDACFSDENIGLWIVADGMGGHERGDLASQIAIKFISEEVSKGNNLKDAILASHYEIQKASLELGGDAIKPMGTTVVAALLTGLNYQIAWAGDSRAYLMDSHLSLLTKDHSYVQRLLDLGLINEQEAEDHPNKNIITQSLGATDTDKLNIDVINGSLAEGQKLLLCSDGLSNEVLPADLEHLLQSNKAPDKAVKELVLAANQAGGRDNISALVINIIEKNNNSPINSGSLPSDSNSNTKAAKS